MKLGDSLGRNRKRRKRKADDDGADPEAVEEREATPDDEVRAGEEPLGAAGESPAFGHEEATSDAPDPWTPGAAPLAAGSGPGTVGRLRAWLNGRNLFVALGAMILGGWFVGYALATQVFFPAPPPPGDLYEVPDLRGLGVASAEERLAGAGLELGGTDSITHPSVASGLIIGQSPLPGQVSRPDAPVRVTVSMGPQMRSVPDVLRLDEARARVVLETSGFVVDVRTTEAEEPRGQVVQVTPPPDSVVALPAEVRLLVSAGPPVVVMPLLLGLEQAEAEMMLDSLGLQVSDVEEVFRFGRDQGIVVEQEPAADTELRRGSGVRLKVGRRGADWEQ